MAPEREQDGEKAALFAMGEYCAYHGYGDVLLPIMNKIDGLGYHVKTASSFHLQSQFFTLIAALSGTTYRDQRSFDTLLAAFDCIYESCVHEKTILEYKWITVRYTIIQQMGINLLRQLVCKESGDLDPSSADEINPVASFEYDRYCKFIEDVFQRHKHPSETVQIERRVQKAITELTAIMTSANTSKKSKNQILDKSVVHELLLDKSLTQFKTQLAAFGREVQKKVAPVPHIAIQWQYGEQGGAGMHTAGHIAGSADWTQEQRYTLGPYAAVGAGAAGRRAADQRAAGAGAGAGSGAGGGNGAAFSPVGGDAMELGELPASGRSVKGPTPQKAAVAAATRGKAAASSSAGVKTSTYKAGDVRKAVGAFNQKASAKDPLNDILSDMHLAPVDSKIASTVRLKKRRLSSSAAALEAAAGTDKEGQSQSQQSVIADDISEEIMTQAQFVDEEALLGKGTNGKRHRGAKKASSSSSSSSSSGAAVGAYVEAVYMDDDNDDDFIDARTRGAEKPPAKPSAKAATVKSSPKRAAKGAELVQWDEDDELFEADDIDSSDSRSAKRPRSASKIRSTALRLKMKTCLQEVENAKDLPAGPGKKMALAAGKEHASKASKSAQCRMAWSFDEVDAFRRALKTHQRGNWQLMLDDPRFSATLERRTAVNLKDKYRNMVKTGEIGPDSTH